MTLIETNGITLDVTDTGGTGQPVVLLHGFPDSAAGWRYQIPALVGAGHRVIVPDLRGYGASSRPPDVDQYRMRTLIADVTGLLDTLGLQRADLVGHDWGASLAWSVAMFAPARVRRLAVLSVGHASARDAAGWEQKQQSWYMLWFLFPGVAEAVMPADDWAFVRKWAARQPGFEDELERQIAGLAQPGALTAALNWYRANIDPAAFVAPPSRLLPHVQCPTLGVWSDEDPYLGEVQMTASEQYVDGAWRYVRISGVDHWLPTGAADAVNELLIDFLGA